MFIEIYNYEKFRSCIETYENVFVVLVENGHYTLIFDKNIVTIPMNSISLNMCPENHETEINQYHKQNNVLYIAENIYKEYKNG